MYGSQRITLRIVPQELSTLISKAKSFTVVWGLTSRGRLGWLAGIIGVCHCMLYGLNSGSLACEASFLLTELSPQPF